MPQMAPIWWTFLMILFIVTMFMMVTTMYFNTLNKPMKKKEISTNQMIWKW
uniref:ATP synthase complex subunit 8 n=1 Tax=Atkinsoniella zizhongi TaxID=2971512 RepID=A0A976U586_9HEMI|nr:ATP synthase F0 subunit 8 [Atkinsoniella zizhongi]UVF28953.1 ATP synthase F0 subunit 8 [Atkinsoniella zizhongi]